MWNDSDRMGYKDFLGYEVKNNLFIIPPKGQKGSVWYSFDEFVIIENRVKEQLANNFDVFTGNIFSRLEEDWVFLLPYLLQEKEIQSGEEFAYYYEKLVHWWSAMNTVFSVPDMEEAPQDLKEKILSIRTESEKFTEQMNKNMVQFFEKYFPAMAELSHVTLPKEVVLLSEGELSDSELEQIRLRLQGCFELNEEVCLMQELDSRLELKGLILEREEAQSVSEIKGAVSFKGLVRGKVRVVRNFKDLPSVEEGEILVTEMTNPDYVPTMKKVIGIITDEGGVTCHAAIVSRELKIPCIVGTKISTQVLKNGDMVELDANTGIIKIL
jgi:phosphohistidine swiveling domain-containing protein